MASLSSILVLGPTGVVGSFLLPALISQKDKFTRIAVFDNTDRPASLAKAKALKELENQGIEIVSGTYDSIASFEGFGVVLMLLGNHGLHLQPQIIDTAISAGVRHFYPSEFGADLSVGDNSKQRYYTHKVATREHLLKRSRDVPDLGWTIVQVGRLTEYSVIRHLGVNTERCEANIFGTKNGRQSLLSMKDTIFFTIKTLLDIPGSGSAPRHRNLRFHGSSPSWDELFAILEKVTGHKYNVTYHPIDGAIKDEARAKQLGDVDAELEASHKLVQGRGGTLLPEPYDNWRYPDIEPEGVEEALERAFSDPRVANLLGLKR